MTPDPAQGDQARAHAVLTEMHGVYPAGLPNMPVKRHPVKILVEAFATVRAEAVKGLVWSSEKPGKAGFWWWRAKDCEPCITLLYDDGNGVGILEMDGLLIDDLESEHKFEDMEWSGPLTPPAIREQR